MAAMKGFHWSLLATVYLGSSVVGTELDTCPRLACCEEDCCGEGTSWATGLKYCIPLPGSPGFNGTYSSDNPGECQEWTCCKETCCYDGTYFDEGVGCCLPILPEEPTASYPTEMPFITKDPTMQPTTMKPTIKPTKAPTTSPAPTTMECTLDGPECARGFFCWIAPKECDKQGAVGKCIEDVFDFGDCEDNGFYASYGSPVCGCNNRQYFNECFAAMEGVSVKHFGYCECTSDDTSPCPQQAYFCNVPPTPEACTGVGNCRETNSQYGNSYCASERYDPVCGCNNYDYSNPCLAALDSTSIQYKGECIRECTLENPECPGKTEYCKFADGDCGNNGTGVCTDKPNVDTCSGLLAPVCGCDGNTYSNPCVAESAGVSVETFGACE